MTNAFPPEPNPTLTSLPPACLQVNSIGGLDAKIDATGGNAWSLGQQQLMCLARAALKKVPVLCLDEATAAMDPHTEAHVLEIIERLFSDRTTFTIAHRWAALHSLPLRAALPLLPWCTWCVW
jgi:ABC-type multidrug transport system fused ATPase/permease subunit